MADSSSSAWPNADLASDSVDQKNNDADVPTDGATTDAIFLARAPGAQRSGPSAPSASAQRIIDPTIPATSAKQHGKQRECRNVPRDDDCATQATTQESRWRDTGAKRTATTMSTDERNAKRAAHKREVRARQAAERAAAAAAARVPDRRRLNRWLGAAKEDEEWCNEGEWDAFEEYTIQNTPGVADFDEFDDDELERDAFLEMFLDWRESDEYEQYEENERYEKWEARSNQNEELRELGSENSSPRAVSLLQPSLTNLNLCTAERQSCLHLRSGH